jgi:serine phosphatase RsbU (regulator of sigma subunit)
MKINRFLILFLFSVIFASSLCAQSRLDTLLLQLDQAGDTVKVNALIGVSREYRGINAQKAIEYGLKAVDMARELDFKRGLAAGLNNLGIAYRGTGEYEKAVSSHLEALRIYESLSNKRGAAASLSNLGSVYTVQEDFTQALYYHLEALKLDEEMGDRQAIASSLNNIGNDYYFQGDYTRALDYYQRSVEIKTEIGAQEEVAASLNNIGQVYESLNNLDKALKYYSLALNIMEEQELTQEIVTGLYNIGNVYAKQGNYAKGEEYIKRSLGIARTIGDREGVMYAFETLSGIYEQQGNYKEALEYQRLYSAARDSLFSEAKSKQMLEMSSKYESEKKEGEIKLLTQENSLRESQLARQKLLNYSIIVGLLLVVFFSFFLYRQYREKQRAHHLLEEKNKEITDSIRYAKHIQESILPPAEVVKTCLPDSFVLYLPKDIVSGDFYWIDKKDNRTFVAAVDCTGHGVPGAFMSIVGHSLLQQAVNEKGLRQPSLILDELNLGVLHTLRQDQLSSSRDGMDIALCCIDFQNRVMEYAGAYNPLWLVREGKLEEIKANRHPVGFVSGTPEPFTNHVIPVKANDVIYIFSDGYADQFGGEKGKKFRYRELQNLLISICGKPMNEQRDILEQAFLKWKGDLEQVDDILIIGIRL